VMKPGTNGKIEDDVENRALCLLEGFPGSGSIQFRALYPKGCYDGLRDFVQDNSIIIIAVLSSFVGIEILGLIFSCLLMKCK